MRVSLVIWTLVLVGGVVLAGGAGVLAWITSEDLDAAREDAAAEQQRSEAALKELAAALVKLSQDTAHGLVEGAETRSRQWIEQEPFSLYRDAADPERVDVEALKRALVSGARRRSRDELRRIDVLADRMGVQSDARIEARMSELRAEAAVRAERASSARADKLSMRFGMLLLGMAVLLALTLVVLVVGPVRRLRSAVNRIAEGDLSTPVPQARGGAIELVGLAGDVERMRDQIRVATEGLEDEVRRKTETLEATLEERTQALEELRATQDRLVQTEKMAGLGTLAGGVAHEFNNLIGGILGCLESVRSATTNEAVLEDIDMAKRTADRAAVLVRALLDVARPPSRKLAPVSLGRVVADVLRTAEPSARQSRVTLEAHDGDAPEVLGDDGQLHQVVLNLVTNAIHASDEGDRVTVTTGTADGAAVIEVCDEGPGVPEADRTRIFEPFFTAREGGTGLGLFISYGIIERHGGRIEVGEAPGGGARFSVSLPKA